MVIKIDFEGVETREGFSDKILDPGVYDVKIKSVRTEDKSEYGGLQVTYECTDEKYNNQWVFGYMSFHPKALWKLKMELTALGIDCEGEIDLDPSELVGSPCQIKVIVKDHWNGERDEDGNIKKQNDVEQVLPPSDGASFGW